MLTRVCSSILFERLVETRVPHVSYKITHVGLYCMRVLSFVELQQVYFTSLVSALTRVVATVQCKPRNKPRHVVVALVLLLLFTIKSLHLLYFYIFF